MPIFRGRLEPGKILLVSDLWAFLQSNALIMLFGKARNLRGGSTGSENIRKTGGAVMRVKVTLSCTECKQRNYNTMKNKKNNPDRLEMNKYCRFCKKHTLHRETK